MYLTISKCIYVLLHTMCSNMHSKTFDKETMPEHDASAKCHLKLVLWVRARITRQQSHKTILPDRLWNDESSWPEEC